MDPPCTLGSSTPVGRVALVSRMGILLAGRLGIAFRLTQGVSLHDDLHFGAHSPQLAFSAVYAS